MNNPSGTQFDQSTSELSSVGLNHSDSFTSSIDQTPKASRFDAGKLTVRAVVVLMWLHSCVRVYKLLNLFQLLSNARHQLSKASSILNSPSEEKVVVNWVIILLSLNVALTVGTFAAVLFVSANYLCQCQPSTTQLEKRTKTMLRTIGTVHFYFALLPDSLVTLMASERISALSTRIGRRLCSGQLPVEAVQQLVQNFRCPAPNCLSGSHPAGGCHTRDPHNSWDGAMEFFDPMRRHLKLAFMLEAWVQMALILVAFLVSHLIRTRNPRELDHKNLLRQSSYCRDLDRQGFLDEPPQPIQDEELVESGSKHFEIKKVV